MTQIEKGTEIPIVHTVELLDWATGGPVPAALEAAGFSGRLAVDPPRVAAE
jgi:glycolate oxidase iron-sulfur subunit